jgi:phospholipase D1/2
VTLTICSPELYLRRPPSRNERYRLDNLLKAAAERGVKINVVVYKEVPQALSCKCFPCLHQIGTTDRPR